MARRSWISAALFAAAWTVTLSMEAYAQEGFHLPSLTEVKSQSINFQNGWPIGEIFKFTGSGWENTEKLILSIWPEDIYAAENVLSDVWSVPAAFLSTNEEESPDAKAIAASSTSGLNPVLEIVVEGYDGKVSGSNSLKVTQRTFKNGVEHVVVSDKSPFRSTQEPFMLLVTRTATGYQLTAFSYHVLNVAEPKWESVVYDNFEVTDTATPVTVKTYGSSGVTIPKFYVSQNLTVSANEEA